MYNKKNQIRVENFAFSAVADFTFVDFKLAV